MPINNSVNYVTTSHDVLVGAANNLITNVAPSATSGIPLVSNGASSDPSFTTAVVAGGGTGTITFTAYSVLCAGTTATGAFQNVVGVGTSGQVLQSAGASALPAWTTATFPATATGTGTILRADGTNWVATTSTYPNTNAISTLLYASAANVMSALATANDGLLVTSHTGVPSILAGPGAAGKVLQSNSATPPSYSTATYPATATSAGTILISDGTNWTVSTPTYPTSFAQGDIIYASGTNALSALAKNASSTRYLSNTGTSNNPAWAQVAMTTGVSDYTSTSWTPTLTFGGSATSIAYTTHTGTYVRIGNLVWINARITLTNNGTGVGQMKILGLPVTAATSNDQPMILFMYAGITLTTNYTTMIAIPDNAATTMTCWEIGSGQSIANLTDTLVTNTADFAFSGVYSV